MFEVRLVRADKTEVLGNLDGQGFYDYKKVSTVVNKLYAKMSHLPERHKQGCHYEIYSGYDWLHTDKLELVIDIK